MNLGLPRTAGALLSAAALVLGSATASSAAVWTHTDPTGDVRTVTSDSSGDHFGPADPTLTTPDITRIRVAHNRGAVVVKTTLLAGLPTDDWEWVATIRTPTHRYFFDHAKAGRAENVFFGPGLDRVRCPGLKIVVGSPRTLVTTTIPRSCIDNPAWVRFGVALVTFDATSLSSGTFTGQVDDANSASSHGNPVLSPKVLAPKGAKIA